MADFDFDAKNRTVHATHFWTVTAVSDKSKHDAQLTFIASILTIISCTVTISLYFKYRSVPAVFNSSNHFFCMSFALAILGACNYATAAGVRMWSKNIDLLVGYCDVSAVHVLIVVYPSLLCELLYFWSAYRRLKAAQLLTKTGAGSGGSKSGGVFVSSAAAVSSTSNFRASPAAAAPSAAASSAGSSALPSSNRSTGALARRLLADSASHSNLAYGAVESSESGQPEQEAQQQQQHHQNSPTENLETALSIVDSGDAFFRRAACAVIFVMALIAIVVSAALPIQKRWDTRFDPSTAAWCWIPVADGDDDADQDHPSIHVDRDGGFIALQLIIEIPALIGTPAAGIISLVMLYKALSSFPRAAKLRALYIIIFILTFVAGIVLRLRFDSGTSASFVAFCEPSIGFFNSLCFIASEIWPAIRQRQTRTMDAAGASAPTPSTGLLQQRSASGSGTGGQVVAAQDEEGDYYTAEADGNGDDDDDDELYIEPTLAVLIEAAAYVRAAVATNQRARFVVADDEDDEQRGGGDGDGQQQQQHGQLNNDDGHHEIHARITDLLEAYGESQRKQSTQMLHFILSCICGFLDTWAFVAFGVFCTTAAVANVGVSSLAIAYNNWAPAYAKFAHPLDHSMLTLIAVFLPVISAAVCTRIVFGARRGGGSCCYNNNNKDGNYSRPAVTIGRGTAMLFLAAATGLVVLVWLCGLEFYSRSWFRRVGDEPGYSRYVSVAGLSLFSGLLIAFHTLFTTNFRSPTTPYLITTLFDFVSFLGTGCIALLSQACDSRYPLPLRRSTEVVSALGYLVGAGMALVGGVYETGGAFVFAPNLALFALLLSLEDPCLADSVTVSADEPYLPRSLMNRLGGFEQRQSAGGGDEYTAGGVRRSTRDALRRSLMRRASDVSLHPTPVVSDARHGGGDGDSSSAYH